MKVKPKLTNFNEYNQYRRGKERLFADFNFPYGEQTCGLCSRLYIANDYIFLICYDCLTRNVEPNPVTVAQHYVYGLYNMSDECVYIGVTSDPVLRLHNHMLSKNFKYMRIVRSFNIRQDADDYEKFSIHSLNPRLNILIVEDWNREPENWDEHAFGKIAGPSRRRKPARKTNQVKQTVKQNKPKRVRKPSTPKEPNRAQPAKYKHTNSVLDVGTICFSCQKHVSLNKRAYVKDKLGNKAVFHESCLNKIASVPFQ